MTEQQRERRAVFGEAVEQYESSRPGYPPELVADVLAYAGVGSQAASVLEVGAGTGKATVSFATYGLDLTCVEPDPRMAQALRRNCPDVRVVVNRFEEWRPDRGFGLLYSAQAWHWVDEERRTDLAHAALAPGGALALFWNIFAVTDRALHAALAQVDVRHGLSSEHSPHRHHADDFAGEISDDFAAEWPTLRLTGDQRFTELRSVRYRRPWSYPAAGYLDLLRSTSIVRVMEPDRREPFLADVAAAVEAHGPTMDLTIVSDLALARRR